MSDASQAVDRSEIESIVASATRAPSVHNSQPWSFVASTQSSQATFIDMYAVTDRALPVIDPNGRELHISCGAAVELARIASRYLGIKCRIELLPDRDDSEHLARIHLGDRSPATPHEQDLGRALARRYTERSRFEDRPVEREIVEKLRATASVEDTWMRVLDNADDETALAVLLSHADELERKDPRYEGELATWLRTSGDGADGIPPEAASDATDPARATSLHQRDFHVGDTAETPRDPDALPPAAEHPLVVVIGTPGDDPRAWLQAGLALGRLLVEAAAEGVEASPLTQVLEIPSTRQMVASALGLLGHVQMVLRMGYASGAPVTQRRPLEEVLSFR